MEKAQVTFKTQHIWVLFYFEFPIVIQEVSAGCRVSVNWAYRNLGLFSSTDKANVTVEWDGNSILLDAGQVLVVKAAGGYDVD